MVLDGYCWFLVVFGCFIVVVGCSWWFLVVFECFFCWLLMVLKGSWCFLAVNCGSLWFFWFLIVFDGAL